MGPDFSWEAFQKFLNYIDDKGLVSRQQAQNWRVASAKIEKYVGEAPLADVRKIDVDEAFQRFANKEGGAFTPQTLGEYRRRAGSALANFIQWASNPEAYKPKVSKASQKRGEQNPGGAGGQSGSGVFENPARMFTAPTTRIPHNANSLTLPFPLRADFLAQVSIPHDLKVDEAKRLGAFLLTLAQDFSPQT